MAWRVCARLCNKLYYYNNCFLLNTFSCVDEHGCGFCATARGRVQSWRRCDSGVWAGAYVSGRTVTGHHVGPAGGPGDLRSEEDGRETSPHVPEREQPAERRALAGGRVRGAGATAPYPWEQFTVTAGPVWPHHRGDRKLKDGTIS